MAVGVPVGYSGASAVQMVRDLLDEPTLPSDATILSFLNAGIEQVEMRLNGIKKIAFYPTVANQTTLQLDNDIQEIIACNFSSGAAGPNGNMGSASPFAQGALVYPMFPLSEGTFMDAAAGFPAVGFGPPQYYLLYQDEGSNPNTTLPPPPPALVVAVAGNSNGLPLAFVLTYVNANGETTASQPPTVLTPLKNQSVSVFSPPAEANATGWNCYVSENGGPFYLNNPTPIALGTPWVFQEVARWDYAAWDEAIWPGTYSMIKPPTENTATGVGQGGTLYMQVYPAAMIGQVNVYYRARPLLWADTSSSSWTNLDTMAQELAIIEGCIRTLKNRSRMDEVDAWVSERDNKITELSEAIARRTRPKSGVVRDVRDRAYPGSPWWGTSA
jgi:hypothetical protein